MSEKKRLNAIYIITYLVIFFALWSIRGLIILPVYLDQLDGIAFQVADTAIKLLIWTLPAIILIKYFQGDMWVNLKGMFTSKPKWSKTNPYMRPKETWFSLQSSEESPQWSIEDLFILVAIILLFPLRAFGSLGTFAIHPDFTPVAMIGSVIFVGITEEVVFRGWLLNASLKKIKLGSAVLLNMVLFTLIHYPFWIYLGYNFAAFLSGSAAVMLLSVLCSYSFVRTKNIIVPIGLHMIWNLSIALFAGS